MKFSFCYLIIGVLLAMSSCEKPSNTYNISGEIKNKLGHDSVCLYVYEQHYGKLLLLNKQPIVSSRFNLTGAISDAQIAFVQLAEDSIPYYLVLDSSPLTMEITKTTYKIRGSEENNKYYKYLQNRQKILNEKKAIWNKYMTMAADSTLTDSAEIALKGNNDALIDSLGKMTLHYIEQKNVSSTLVENQFGNYITIE